MKTFFIRLLIAIALISLIHYVPIFYSFVALVGLILGFVIGINTARNTKDKSPN